MILTVIIVNYNVKHFLEQCLFSVMKAIHGLDAEVFVVDNNSVDGSCKMVREKFPLVKLIENKQNYGFSYANNQAIRQSSGKFILLLNPDTVVEEDTFTHVTDFMEDHSDAGGLGVKMIDGKGNYLPESKRSVPTPLVAFYKITGLSGLFPGSRTFNRYHLGFLNPDETHEIEVLSGAFMCLSRSALEKVGLLDEDYFMYGEDIDISYRLLKGGYRNYYYPGTTIIHYKGESTRKSSINYVLVFYKAMIIFARKHFTHSNARIFSLLINLAIYFRASVAIVTRFIKISFLPVLDALAIFTGYYLALPYWEHYKPGGGIYPDTFLFVAVPAYIIIWLLSVSFSGAYEKPVKLIKLLKGLSIGTVIILLIYSLLNEQYRFSRALILFGFAWSAVILTGLRFLLHLSGLRAYRLDTQDKKKIVIVGYMPENRRVNSLLKQSGIRFFFAGNISPLPGNEIDSDYIGNVSQLKEIVMVNEIDEIIFCASDISSQEIIRNMHYLTDVNVEYKIAPPESISVIGSNSIDMAGELYVIRNNSIARDKNHKKKRLFDIAASLSVLLCSPFLIFINDKPANIFINVFRVLSGSATWIGYHKAGEPGKTDLPPVKPGVLTPLDVHRRANISVELAKKLNLVYSNDYKTINDLLILYRGCRNLGRNVS